MSDMDDLGADPREVTQAEIDALVPPFKFVRPPLKLSPYARALPFRAMGVAKEAALAADVSLRWWEEVKKTAYACLRNEPTAEESAEDTAALLRILEERFEVS